MSPYPLKTPACRLMISLTAGLVVYTSGGAAFADGCNLQQLIFTRGDVANDALSASCRVAQTQTLSFRTAFQRVVDEATLYLMAHERTGNEAVVLDLDETLMDNRAYFLVYQDYDSDDWADWVHLAQAPAIPETLMLVRWLKAHDYKVYFISGRKEAWRADTEQNLHQMGVPTWDGMFLRPDDYDKDSAADFKTAARRAITDKGETVVLSIGDQKSDLKGGYGEGFLLPNPIYFIP